MILEKFRVLYNTRIILFPGGLTPKAQIMDMPNNRPFKVSFRKKICKIWLEKYKAAKAQRDSNHTGKKTRVAIPKIDRAEALQCMLDAWEELPATLGANAWTLGKWEKRAAKNQKQPQRNQELKMWKQQARR